MLKTVFSLLFLTCFGLTLPAATIILTSDQQLNELLDPDKKIDLSTGYQKRIASLRDVCEAAQKNGDQILTIAFDEFFRQYREHAGTERKLTPDQEEYIDKIKVIADFAENYGLSMGLSLLSPLELGPAFKNQTGKNGEWLHYKVGLRDPVTGKFSVPLWQQLHWTNNKGQFRLQLAAVTAYAFEEKEIPGTPYRAVDRDRIIALESVKVDTLGLGPGVPQAEDPPMAKRIRVYSDGSADAIAGDKVMVVLKYEVPEMEYFDDQALPFLKQLLNRYHEREIQIEHFYSDEMHIQQDWYYFNHMDNGQFATRYYTPALGKMYQEKFGVPFEEKDILYFVYGPNISSHEVDAAQNVQYVMDTSLTGVQQTFLFRDRYYKMLNFHVVDLFKAAKEYASDLFGVADFGTSGHASWAESPTVDYWDTGTLSNHAYKYEYTSNFVWGNTVQQAAAACYDYFKWGEYLEPTRNDFGELGWNDRNYYGAAMAASIGVVNRIPNAYPAVWGMPDRVKERKLAVNDAYGGRPRSEAIDLVTGHRHREVDVLILYPMSLVACEERFGSWMTQYGYANFITADKLLELGRVDSSGTLVVKDQRYRSLVAMFEPLPEAGLLDMFSSLTERGGNAFWFGPPPLMDGAGEACLEQWESIFGVDYTPTVAPGQIAPGKKIAFTGNLSSVPEQYILTDFLVDRIYPVEARPGTRPAARCDGRLVGASRENAHYFGFRPRDDQSASLGYETRTLFEILDRLGAHPPTQSNSALNDNTEHVSRTTDFLTTRFPNGATVIVKHYRRHRESWHGGFSRDQKRDSLALAKNPVPSDSLDIQNLQVNGHTVSYQGRLSLAFRVNDRKELVAFDGRSSRKVEIDGSEWVFSEKPVRRLSFSPALAEGNEMTEYRLFVDSDGTVTVPLPGSLRNQDLALENAAGANVEFEVDDTGISLVATDEINGQWLTLKPAE